MSREERIQQLSLNWKNNPRWHGVQRTYSSEQVVNLAGSVRIEYSLAKLGATRLWYLLRNESCVTALGAMTGLQAVQQIQAGLKAIYVSGWQVAADANHAGHTYPDQSLYPADSVPSLVKRINNALLRADQIQHQRGEDGIDWLAPIIADAEAGFGGALNCFELMKMMIEAGAAAVHFEDQLSSAKKCGHLGGKVLVPTREAVDKLISARLAADVTDVPTIIIARTDAHAANLLTSDVDERDHAFLTGERTVEGFFQVKPGIEQAISRGLAYAPYADMIWCETSHPDLDEAKAFADGIHRHFPGKMLAYNCSPSFNWAAKLNERQMLGFRERLAEMGYKFQFVTLAGFHSLNTGMFELASAYRQRGMAGYSELQQREFALQQKGFNAVRHQAFVGTAYFDAVQETLSGGQASTTAMSHSTEAEQFGDNLPERHVFQA